MSNLPLNILQKLMRRWDAVHPYNAAQVMKLTGTPDAQKWNTAWGKTLETTGLGSIAMQGNRYGFVALNGHLADYGVKFPHADLEMHISAGLNQPFDDPNEPPFRPFVIAERNQFHAGVIYQHWLADSVSIRRLMREWFLHVYDPNAASVKPMPVANRGYWSTIGARRGGFAIARSVVDMGRRHVRMRRVQKIDSVALSEHATRFHLVPAPSGLIDRVRIGARDRQVKVNDIFLAALLEACAARVPLQARKKRTDIAVGSVVDLRPWCGKSIVDTFGLFLGFTNVICGPKDLENFDSILQAVALQTGRQKSTGVAPASLMWMTGAFYVGKLSKPGELYHFYRKELPLVGGISNVDLTRAWPAEHFPDPLLDYIRVSPTGPMAPLAVTTTTLGSQFHLGVTHRTGLITDDAARAIAATFLSRLMSL